MSSTDPEEPENTSSYPPATTKLGETVSINYNNMNENINESPNSDSIHDASSSVPNKEVLLRGWNDPASSETTTDKDEEEIANVRSNRISKANQSTMGSVCSVNRAASLYLLVSLLVAPVFVKGQTFTPNGVPVIVTIDISRNPSNGFVTFNQQQSGSFVVPSGATAQLFVELNSRFEQTTITGGVFSSFGFVSPGIIDSRIQYTFTLRTSYNVDVSCLGVAQVTQDLDPGIPTLLVNVQPETNFSPPPGSINVAADISGAQPASLSGTSTTDTSVSLGDLGLNECSVCFYEYDTDNNPSNGLEAAIVWNVGSNDGLACPTLAPSDSPSESQAPSESKAPSFMPSNSPSESQAPSSMPSNSPSESQAPSSMPSDSPSESQVPSTMPSNSPSESQAPSSMPSDNPSASSAPSFMPSDNPSASLAPSSMPSDSPSESQAPSSVPSDNPSASSAPSSMPSDSPSESQAPSSMPSDNPSASSAPSFMPSDNPSASSAPSSMPSDSPSESQAPSSIPSDNPSASSAPSSMPTTFCLKERKTKSPGKGTKSPGKGTKSPGKGGGKGMMMTKSPVQTCFETAFPTNSPGKGKRDI